MNNAFRTTVINLKVRPSAEDGLVVVAEGDVRSGRGACKRRGARSGQIGKAPRSGRSSADNSAVDIAAVDVRRGNRYGAGEGRRCSRSGEAKRRLKRGKLGGKLAALDYLIGVVSGQRVFCAEVSSRGVRDSDDSLLAGRCPSVYFPLSDFR